MVNGIREILNEKQLPEDSRDKRNDKRIPIGSVDALADELVAEYSNPVYRKWYCRIIYRYGVEQTLEWRRRAKDGDYPAKLFSKYVKDAETYRGAKKLDHDSRR